VSSVSRRRLEITQPAMTRLTAPRSKHSRRAAPFLYLPTSLSSLRAPEFIHPIGKMLDLDGDRFKSGARILLAPAKMVNTRMKLLQAPKTSSELLKIRPYGDQEFNTWPSHFLPALNGSNLPPDKDATSSDSQEYGAEYRNKNMD
jgi:hypothetical protein